MEVVATLERRRLRERLDGVRPSILAVFAPAGYGKTTFLEQFYGGRAATTFCSCDGLRDDVDLARRLFPALEPVLADGSRTVAERLDLAAAQFASSEGAVFVFDRARFIGRNVAAFEFFVRLLNRRPVNSTIVIVSREPLPLRLTRFAAPHDVLVLRAEDLAFDEAEIRSMFASYVSDTPALARIVEVSRGWPIALFLLLRFAREHRLRALLERLDDAMLVELRDYLTEEVLGGLDQAARQALFACAALPRAYDADVRDAFPLALAGETLASFAQDSPFLNRRRDGSYTVHPIVAAAVLEHQEERRALVLTQLAMQRAAEADYIRASELYAAGDDADAAVAALAQHDILSVMRLPPRYVEILERLDPVRVARYPHLWGMRAALRLFREPADVLLDEAQAVWRTIPPHGAMRDRYPVFVLRMLLMGLLGQFAQASVQLDEMSAAIKGTKFEAHVALLRSFVGARAGRLEAAQRDAEAAMDLDADMTAAFLYMTLGSEIARPSGDRMESQLLQRAMERAKGSGMTSIYALLVAQNVICAWLAGDGAAVVRHAEELQRLVDMGYAAFARLAGAALTRETRATMVDLDEYTVYANLIELSRLRDERRRAQMARESFALSRRLGSPFLETLAALAVAFSDESAWDEFSTKAVEASSSVQSAALHRAAAAVAERRADSGMLTAFVNRMARDDERARAPIEISFSAATVRVDGNPIDLGGRELELLLAIAVRKETSSRSRLASLLWPDLDEDSARNAFSVCLHRLRSRLPRKDLIEREGDGYRVHALASVDLWELERIFEKPQKKNVLTDRERTPLERLWRLLSSEAPVFTERWDWFEPIARRLRESRVTVAHLLGQDALARGDVHSALRYSDGALRDDSCDEQAAEIGIRAHLAAGDRAAAMRRYRQYRSALHAELGAEPSFSLTALVTTA